MDWTDLLKLDTKEGLPAPSTDAAADDPFNAADSSLMGGWGVGMDASLGGMGGMGGGAKGVGGSGAAGIGKAAACG